jgi:hypothetical protein
VYIERYSIFTLAAGQTIADNKVSDGSGGFRNDRGAAVMIYFSSTDIRYFESTVTGPKNYDGHNGVLGGNLH